MKKFKFLILIIVCLFLTSIAIAGESKVYTDGDLEQYKSGKEEGTYYYNKQIFDEYGRLEEAQKQRELEKQYNELLQQNIEAEKRKQQAAGDTLKRIAEEQEKTNKRLQKMERQQQTESIVQSGRDFMLQQRNIMLEHKLDGLKR